MRGRWTVVGLGCVAMAIAALGGCGGSDDADETDDGVSETSEPTSDGDDAASANDDGDTGDGDAGDDEANSDDANGSDGTAEEMVGDGDDGDGDDGDGDDGDGDDGDGAVGGGDYRCDDIFSMADVEAWFGEAAELTEDRMDSIGQIVCTWETIEDPAATDDLAFQLITAQIFTGEGVPAASFIDPEVFDEVTMIDDIGDLAFYEESFGRNYYFLDEPIAGSFSVSDVDMGAADAPKRHTAEEVDDLFRQFHASVTG